MELPIIKLIYLLMPVEFDFSIGLDSSDFSTALVSTDLFNSIEELKDDASVFLGSSEGSVECNFVFSLSSLIKFLYL